MKEGPFSKAWKRGLTLGQIAENCQELMGVSLSMDAAKVLNTSSSSSRPRAATGFRHYGEVTHIVGKAAQNFR